MTLFDTAETHGPFHNERRVGSAPARVRDRVRIATKVGFVIDYTGRLIVDSSPARLAAALL